MIRDFSPTALQPCHEIVPRSDLNCGVSSLHHALRSRSGGAYACVKKIAFAATTVFALWDRHAALGVPGCLVRGGIGQHPVGELAMRATPSITRAHRLCICCLRPGPHHALAIRII
jgi:hypothetical protein